MSEQFDAKALIMGRVEQGESLVKTLKSPHLKMLSRATVCRWIQKDKLPSLKLGRIYYSTNSVIVEALERIASAPPKQTEKTHLEPANDAHEAALEALKRKGIIKNDFKPRQD